MATVLTAMEVIAPVLASGTRSNTRGCVIESVLAMSHTHAGPPPLASRCVSRLITGPRPGRGHLVPGKMRGVEGFEPDRLHRRVVLSALPVTSQRPPGLNTARFCACRSVMLTAVVAVQSHRMVSL